MTAQQAAAQIVTNRSPEYQSKIKARTNHEDVNELVKKEVSIGDFASKFGGFFSPQVQFTPEARSTVLSSYAELVKDLYLDNGDMKLSKNLAAAQLKNTYGVTEVSGKRVVMPYPPEKQPFLAGIDNPADLVARQAVQAIKDETGANVGRGDLVILPIPGVTAEAFRSGKPAPYQLGWFDSQRVLRWTDPGRGFVVDLGFEGSLRSIKAIEEGAIRERDFKARDQFLRDAPDSFARAGG
jgi:hypothetical protein